MRKVSRLPSVLLFLFLTTVFLTTVSLKTNQVNANQVNANQVKTNQVKTNQVNVNKAKAEGNVAVSLITTHNFTFITMQSIGVYAIFDCNLANRPSGIDVVAQDRPNSNPGSFRMNVHTWHLSPNSTGGPNFDYTYYYAAKMEIWLPFDGWKAYYSDPIADAGRRSGAQCGRYVFY